MMTLVIHCQSLLNMGKIQIVKKYPNSVACSHFVTTMLSLSGPSCKLLLNTAPNKTKFISHSQNYKCCKKYLKI